MQIELNSDEVALIRKLILNELSNLSSEIHHTGTSTVRDELKQYREELSALEKRLSGN